jgi:hypothetical protein
LKALGPLATAIPMPIPHGNSSVAISPTPSYVGRMNLLIMFISTSRRSAACLRLAGRPCPQDGGYHGPIRKAISQRPRLQHHLFPFAALSISSTSSALKEARTPTRSGRHTTTPSLATVSVRLRPRTVLHWSQLPMFQPQPNWPSWLPSVSCAAFGFQATNADVEDVDDTPAGTTSPTATHVPSTFTSATCSTAKTIYSVLYGTEMRLCSIFSSSSSVQLYYPGQPYPQGVPSRGGSLSKFRTLVASSLLIVLPRRCRGRSCPVHH